MLGADAWKPTRGTGMALGIAAQPSFSAHDGQFPCHSCPPSSLLSSSPKSAQSTTPLNRTLWISEAGELTQFGAFIEVLQPGCRSSIKRWHSAEDEMVYVLAGEITAVEGDTETLMFAGDAATFKAGVAVGHYLENRSTAPTRCLVVGIRAAVDRITYPDHGRVCIRDRSLPDDVWTDGAGQPANSPY